MISKKKILIFLFVLLFFYLINSFLKEEVKSFFYSLSDNLQISLLNNNRENYFSSKDQEELNKDLIEENQKLLSNLGELEELKEENQFLKDSLGLKDYENIDLIYGRIISKDFLSDSLLINLGSKDGIKKGFPVVVSNNILLGEIFEVYSSYSRVLLLSSKDNLTDVKVNNIVSLVKGYGNSKINLEMFPRDKELKDGDLILTSPIGGNYPGGLLIGKVSNVRNLDNESFQESDIEILFDPKLIDRIFVLKTLKIFND